MNTLNYMILVTLCCSALSLVGSMMVICSYMVARTTSRPKAAQLIRNLAVTDFMWFFCSLIEACFWVAHERFPGSLCYIFGPLLNFLRIASLIWTCAISFDVLMSVNRRKWLWKSETKGWKNFRRYYYLALIFAALPSALFVVVNQIMYKNADHNCNPQNERLGSWYVVVITELLPMSLGFFFNLFILIHVSHRMSLKSYPQSVRKRRRRIMYHYMIVGIVCWSPTMIHYVLELFEMETYFTTILGVVARATLYLTGFFNFLVFGMQDPHLRRSASVLLHLLGRSLGVTAPETDDAVEQLLSHRDVEKSVMFEESTVSRNADKVKDKKHMFRKLRLSREDKQRLYLERPDLEPEAKPKTRSSSACSDDNNSNNSNNSGANADPINAEDALTLHKSSPSSSSAQSTSSSSAQSTFSAAASASSLASSSQSQQVSLSPSRQGPLEVTTHCLDSTSSLSPGCTSHFNTSSTSGSNNSSAAGQGLGPSSGDDLSAPSAVTGPAETLLMSGSPKFRFPYLDNVVVGNAGPDINQLEEGKGDQRRLSSSVLNEATSAPAPPQAAVSKPRLMDRFAKGEGAAMRSHKHLQDDDEDESATSGPGTGDCDRDSSDSESEQEYDSDSEEDNDDHDQETGRQHDEHDDWSSEDEADDEDHELRQPIQAVVSALFQSS